MQQHEIVSDPTEELILVDSDDSEVGILAKLDCHLNGGVRHRAFSIHVLNAEGQVLLQQRSKDKLLWPGFWSNSCCSHPRAGESMATATRRRLWEELGLQCNLTYLYKFEYRADFGDIGSEHEVCSVYLGYSATPCVPNKHEIAQTRCLFPAEIDDFIAREPDRVTPWFAMEWQRIKTDFCEFLSWIP